MSPSEQLYKDSFLSVQTIVRLGEQDRVRPVGYFVGDFLTTMSGQAVHHDDFGQSL
jgi:hypothetical protein